MSHRHVRSSGRGCPAALGIISLRGWERGAGGSWGTLGSERRRPCLPTYEALAVSQEACPRGSKDTPSTLSLRSGCPGGWPAAAGAVGMGGGDGGAERAQQQSCLQRRGLTSSDQPRPSSQGLLWDTPALQGPYFGV